MDNNHKIIYKVRPTLSNIPTNATTSLGYAQFEQGVNRSEGGSTFI